MRLPNFLFIGPDKTGSSWLYEILLAHPRAFVPDIKDIYFFDRYYQRGLEWYGRYFADAPPDAVAVGELSHDYLFSDEAADRIARDLPRVRLITSLRDPVERTFSHYLYLVRSGLTTDPFEKALDDWPELVANSSYAEHLRRYLDRFPREDVGVFFFDELRADPRAYARRIFDFLALDFVEELPYEERVLEASRPRRPWMARLMKRGAHVARDLGMASLVGRLKRGPLRDALYTRYDEKPRIAPDTAERLRERFAPGVRELERMLGTDLSAWTAPRVSP